MVARDGVRKLSLKTLRGLLFLSVVVSTTVVLAPVAMAATLNQLAPTFNSAPDLVGNSTFTDQLNTDGPAGTVSFLQTSTLVTGVTVSSSGLISSDGTTPVGNYSLSGTDSDTGSDTGVWTYSLTVGVVLAQSPPMSNVNADTVGTTFNDQLFTSTPTGPETFLQTSTVVTGVTVSASGLISSDGTTPVGMYNLSGTDSDTDGDAGTWTYSLTVSSAPSGGGGSPPPSSTLKQTSAISGSTTPNASATFAISPLAVEGAVGAVTYVTTTSSSGLSVSETGVITTTGALVAGTYTVSGTDGDTAGDTGVWTYTLTVNTALATVTFNANGGSGTMAPETESVATKLVGVKFTRDGYVFSDWNTFANGSGSSYANGATFPFSASETLYAQWSVLPIRNVIFDANGGIGSMLPETGNTPTALTLNTFTRVGYKFAGWNTAPNGSGINYANGATYGFSAGVSLFAQWSNGASFTVTFKSNGGTGSMAPEAARVPGDLTLNRFTRAKYQFFKWTTVANGSGSSYANGASYLFTKSITLYAQWHAIKKAVVLPAVNAVISLSPFVANSSSLSSSLESQIAILAKTVKANRDTKIVLVGYSGKLAAVDKLNEAAWAANLKLSDKRAVNVEAFLEQRLSALGVHNYSITAEGSGDSDPPGAIASAVSQAKNRCVIAKIT